MLRREKPDIVDICLPTYLHADYAVKALKHGCHVLTEKPISLRMRDGRPRVQRRPQGEPPRDGRAGAALLARVYGAGPTRTIPAATEGF